MLYLDKEIILKNNKKCLFRSPKKEDAYEMIEYLKACSEETHFILRYPEECNETVLQEEVYLENINNSDTNIMIVCIVDGKIAGNCQLMLKKRLKVKHRASVAIALKKEYWNLGIGTKMFEEMISLAYKNNISQLELEYIEGNLRAKTLYEKMGFVEIGFRPNAIKLKDGTLLKEILMVKEL